MSKANNPIKVLKTAIKRLNKGWKKGDWAEYNPNTGQVSVCLEGAIFGFCHSAKTNAQREAKAACEQIILERVLDGTFVFKDYGPGDIELVSAVNGVGLIPKMNDEFAQTADEMVEICKLAIIRLETGGPIEDDEFIEFDPDGEELADLLPKKS